VSAPKVFLTTMQSCGTGVTLTAATDVVFVDASWNPFGKELQATNRVHRIGQTRETTCWSVMSVYPASWDTAGKAKPEEQHEIPKTMDQMIREVQTNKIVAADAVVGSKYLAEHHMPLKRKREEQEIDEAEEERDVYFADEGALSTSQKKWNQEKQRMFFLAKTIRKCMSGHIHAAHMDLDVLHLGDRKQRLAEWRYSAVVSRRRSRLSRSFPPAEGLALLAEGPDTS